MKIALDAMGGDFAPKNTVAGAVEALRENQQITKLYLVGDTERIKAELAANQCSDPRIEIVHASQVVEMIDGALGKRQQALGLGPGLVESLDLLGL